LNIVRVAGALTLSPDPAPHRLGYRNARVLGGSEAAVWCEAVPLRLTLALLQSSRRDDDGAAPSWTSPDAIGAVLRGSGASFQGLRFRGFVLVDDDPTSLSSMTIPCH
jgi:hypothetical protein